MSQPTLPAPVADLRQSLLAWYADHRRSLPWRSDPQPYYVLLSEFMCQQTRIDTVLPYFARFTARWPTLEDLAAASEDEVVHEWAGLGYYSRARRLLSAAKAAVEQGGLRGDVAFLRALPGVGPYTAGAIASVAFGTDAALVDGNVERVLCRLLGFADDPRRAAGKRLLWERAEELVSGHTDPGSHNQALMELGSLLCTPRSPNCAACPWARSCRARAAGDAEALPNKPKKAPPQPISGLCAVIEREGRVLMGKRGPGLLAGLWEPIMALDTRDVGELVERSGLLLTGAHEAETVVHVFSHRRLSLRVFRVTAKGEIEGSPDYVELDWVDPEAPERGLSKLALKALEAARNAQATLPLAAEARVSQEER